MRRVVWAAALALSGLAWMLVAAPAQAACNEAGPPPCFGFDDMRRLGGEGMPLGGGAKAWVVAHDGTAGSNMPMVRPSPYPNLLQVWVDNPARTAMALTVQAREGDANGALVASLTLHTGPSEHAHGFVPLAVDAQPFTRWTYHVDMLRDGAKVTDGSRFSCVVPEQAGAVGPPIAEATQCPKLLSGDRMEQLDAGEPVGTGTLLIRSVAHDGMGTGAAARPAARPGNHPNVMQFSVEYHPHDAVRRDTTLSMEVVGRALANGSLPMPAVATAAGLAGLGVGGATLAPVVAAYDADGDAAFSLGDAVYVCHAAGAGASVVASSGSDFCVRLTPAAGRAAGTLVHGPDGDAGWPTMDFTATAALCHFDADGDGAFGGSPAEVVFLVPGGCTDASVVAVGWVVASGPGFGTPAGASHPLLNAPVRRIGRVADLDTVGVVRWDAGIAGSMGDDLFALNTHDGATGRIDALDLIVSSGSGMAQAGDVVAGGWPAAHGLPVTASITDDGSLPAQFGILFSVSAAAGGQADYWVRFNAQENGGVPVSVPVLVQVCVHPSGACPAPATTSTPPPLTTSAPPPTVPPTSGPGTVPGPGALGAVALVGASAWATWRRRRRQR